jgi:hypothetical protein
MALLKNYESGGAHRANGQLLAELTKVTVKDSGNLNKVITIGQGLAGTADGPLETEMMIDSAMPKAGAEFAWINALNNREELTIRLNSEGVAESYAMKVNDSERVFSPDAAATKSLTLIGKRIGVTT